MSGNEKKDEKNLDKPNSVIEEHQDDSDKHHSNIENESVIEIEFHNQIESVSSDENQSESDEEIYEPTPAMDSTLEVELDDFDDDDELQSQQPHIDLTQIDLFETVHSDTQQPEIEHFTPVWITLIFGLFTGFAAWILIETFTSAVVSIENSMDALIISSLSGGIVAGMAYLSLVLPGLIGSGRQMRVIIAGYGLILCLLGGFLVGLISQIILSSLDSGIYNSFGLVFIIAIFMGINGCIISLIYQYVMNTNDMMSYLGGFLGGFAGILLPGLILASYPDILRAVSIILVVVLINLGVSFAKSQIRQDMASVQS